MGVLSKPAILRHIEIGNIEISPFSDKNVCNSSYDVRLGKYYFRQSMLKHTQTLNPFYEKSIKSLYGEVETALPTSDYKSKLNPFHNLNDSDLLILISPGETILAHTLEFIGGRKCVTTEMRARSSIGRLGLAVCKCAGWGDVGYVNRWTMEITNFSSCIIPLPVGLRVAQIIFHEVESINDSDAYNLKGKYQAGFDMQKLQNDWKPEMMLPKLYQDQDLGHFGEFA